MVLQYKRNMINMDHYSFALARGDTSQRPTSLQLPVTIPETLQPSRGHSLGHHCFSGKRLSNMVPSLCARSYIPGSGSCQHASLGLDVLRWCCPYFTSFITIHAVLIAIRPSEFLNAMAWPSYNTTIWAYEHMSQSIHLVPCPALRQHCLYKQQRVFSSTDTRRPQQWISGPKWCWPQVARLIWSADLCSIQLLLETVAPTAFLLTSCTPTERTRKPTAFPTTSCVRWCQQKSMIDSWLCWCLVLKTCKTCD